jgi:hypothetical protein
MSADLRYDPLAFERIHVRDEDTLRRVVTRLEDSDAIGVDLEMGQRLERKVGGLQEWIHVLALIQIASESISILVDPLRVADLSPLKGLLGGSIRKVFLGGGQDASLLETAGIPARCVVDVGEIALAVFGRREDGMAALARRIFDLHLDKTVRRADWMVRPLNPTLLAYAYRDAELTLLIYRWFQENYPEAVALHEREQLDAKLGSDIAPWIVAAAASSRSASDPLAVLMEYGFDPKRDGAILSDDMLCALRTTTAPRLVNRLIRIASDVGLRELVPIFLDLTTSQSSLIRMASARALGALASPEVAEPALSRLSSDPIAEVAAAAHAGLKDLRSTKPEPDEEEEADDVPSLDPTSLSALQALMQSMQEEEGVD